MFRYIHHLHNTSGDPRLEVFCRGVVDVEIACCPAYNHRGIYWRPTFDQDQWGWVWTINQGVAKSCKSADVFERLLAVRAGCQNACHVEDKASTMCSGTIAC